MEENKWSILQFADAHGITPQQVIDLMNGKEI